MVAFENSPREICTAAVAILSVDSCLKSLNWFDQTPGNVNTVFKTLPSGVVDFDVMSQGGFDFAASDQGLKAILPMTIDIFVPIRRSDVGGLQADTDIWRYWWCLVRRLMAHRYFGKTVAGANLTAGNVEGFDIKTQETGILARWAWLDIETWVFVNPRLG